MPRYPNGRTLRERLLSRLIIDPSGCLLWTGGRDDDGYGQIRDGDAIRRVHQVMWELLEDPIPAVLQVDHLCGVRHCANLSHLQLVTNRENTLRGQGPAGCH